LSAYSCSSRSTQPSDVSSAATSRIGAKPLPEPGRERYLPPSVARNSSRMIWLAIRTTGARFRFASKIPRRRRFQGLKEHATAWLTSQAHRQKAPLPQGGAFAFAPGNEKPGKPAGRSQVKLGNQNADIRPRFDSVRSLFNRGTNIALKLLGWLRPRQAPIAVTRFTWLRHRRDVRLWPTAAPRAGSRGPACNAARLSTMA